MDNQKPEDIKNEVNQRVEQTLNSSEYSLSDEEIKKQYKRFVKKKRKEFEEQIESSNKFEESLTKLVFEHQHVDTELKDLFHQLNYQRVVDDMSKKILQWKWSVFSFAIFTIFGLYIWATFGDTFVSQNTDTGVLADYERVMSAIDLEINWQKQGNPLYPKTYPKGHPLYSKGTNIDSTFVELNVTAIAPRDQTSTDALANTTSIFWNVYFIRYLLIRVFITLVLIIMLSAGIKVYMRLRRDRMSLIYREEATTSIIYFIEKYMTTKNEKNEKYYEESDKERISQILPLIVKELYYNPDSKNAGKENLSVIEGLMQMTQNMFSSSVANNNIQNKHHNYQKNKINDSKKNN